MRDIRVNAHGKPSLFSLSLSAFSGFSLLLFSPFSPSPSLPLSSPATTARNGFLS